MKNEPTIPRDKARRRDRKPERPPDPGQKAQAEDGQDKRLHLLEHRAHRWARRNAHV